MVMAMIHAVQLQPQVRVAALPERLDTGRSVRPDHYNSLDVLISRDVDPAHHARGTLFNGSRELSTMVRIDKPVRDHCAQKRIIYADCAGEDGFESRLLVLLLEPQHRHRTHRSQRHAQVRGSGRRDLGPLEALHVAGLLALQQQERSRGTSRVCQRPEAQAQAQARAAAAAHHALKDT